MWLHCIFIIDECKALSIHESGADMSSVFLISLLS